MSKKYTRRDFGKMALVGAPVASTLLSSGSLFGQAKPNSRIGGVEIGIISSSLTGMTAADVIPSMLKIGLSEVELQSAHAEALAGAPSANAGGGRGAAAAGAHPPTLNANGLMPRCADMQMVLSPLPPGATPAPAGRGRGTAHAGTGSRAATAKRLARGNHSGYLESGTQAIRRCGHRSSSSLVWSRLHGPGAVGR
jgi:hypothetical protein